MPYPNEHACRIRQPGQFRKDSFLRVTRKSKSKGGKVYSVIRGILKSSGKWQDQAYRYPRKTWSAAEAGSHCKAHKGSFEAAKPSAKRSDGCCGDFEEALNVADVPGVEFVRAIIG